VCGLDPSAELQRMVRARMTATPLEVEFFVQSAEDPVPLSDASIDTVVLTWTLCSVANAPTALQQIKRVLKTDGHVSFLEHGRPPDPGVVAWQDRLTPVWKRVGCGCHLNRKIDHLIEAAGFQISELRTCYRTASDNVHVPRLRAGKVAFALDGLGRFNASRDTCALPQRSRRADRNLNCGRRRAKCSAFCRESVTKCMDLSLSRVPGQSRCAGRLGISL
jgi:SAM-dependent methyltransferase